MADGYRDGLLAGLAQSRVGKNAPTIPRRAFGKSIISTKYRNMYLKGLKDGFRKGQTEKRRKL